jgi:NAD-dependent dihydropyrimidine dehydrogenase PreA subunit
MKVCRKIIKIDEEKCDGCGLCIPGCPEGALQIIDGKARLIKENFCDGLGACIGECPRDALSIEEKEVEEYDEEGVIAHIKEKSTELLKKHLKHLKEHAHELPQNHSHPGMTACPSAKILQWEGKEEEAGEKVEINSELRQWPVQLRLVSVNAPYFQDADLVLIADCVPFAYANLHQELLKGKSIAVGCPKFDEVDIYLDKLTEIFKSSNIKSLKVLHMEVPCCYGLVHLAKEDLKKSGKKIPLEIIKIGIKGEVLSRETSK